MSSNRRITKHDLQQIASRLSDRDRDILESLFDLRYLTTNQIKRLYFDQSIASSATHRATNRALNKLNGFGLIHSLERRIGGVRAGSASYVWCLRPAGFRLLDLSHKASISRSRKRDFEPSRSFLEHHLAISELYIQIILLERITNNLEIKKIETEPDCWRTYIGDSGSITYLKPDLHAVTLTDSFEDHWFFEIDLATESPCRIAHKCQQYHRYYQSGTEQRKHNIFPMVVWIAPNQKRADSLKHHIKEELTPKQRSLFLVILPDQLTKLILEGPSEFSKNEA